jgi:hypothetical protein
VKSQRSRRQRPVHPLRRYREANDYLAVEVADLSGYSPTLISLIETHFKDPGPRAKVRIARALGCRVKDIFPPSELSTADEMADTLAAEGIA